VPDGGKVMESPQSYARHLATYIASPTKIEALTRIEFGRAPPLHDIAKMRLRVEREAARQPRRWIKDSEDSDGEDFRPASIPAPPPPAVRKQRAAYVPVTMRPRVMLPEPVRDILNAAAAQFGLSLELLLSKRKWRELVLARAVAIRLIRDRRWQNGAHRHSLPQIALYMNRDHSTIKNALEQFGEYERQFPEVQQVYDSLRGMADG
jgi:hypothetical protein